MFRQTYNLHNTRQELVCQLCLRDPKVLVLVYLMDDDRQRQGEDAVKQQIRRRGWRFIACPASRRLGLRSGLKEQQECLALFPPCQCQARRAASAELQEKLMEPPAPQGMLRKESPFGLSGFSEVFFYELLLCGDGTCACAGIGGRSDSESRCPMH